MRLIKQSKLEVQTEIPTEIGTYLIYFKVPSKQREVNRPLQCSLGKWDGKIWTWTGGAIFERAVEGWIGPIPEITLKDLS